MSTDRSPTPPVLADIVGQPQASRLLSASLRAPLHAYLFLGPPGSGKREAALAFAAALLCPEGGCGACGACRDALAGRHLDLTVVERQGASILVDEAREVVALAQRAPAASSRQVIVLTDFHLVDQAAPALLKTIEEPPPTTVFIVVADSLPTSLTTIASRCVTVQFVALTEALIAEVLVGSGFDELAALEAAAAAHGRLDRALLLASDPDFGARQARWRALPERLNGTGAAVALAVAELLTDAEALASHVAAAQAAELESLADQAKQRGERGVAGRAGIEARHRRELRRIRTDELRAGLATLAEAYRGRLLAPQQPARRTALLLEALARIDEAARWIERNPNEQLLLQSLLIDLDGES